MITTSIPEALRDLDMETYRKQIIALYKSEEPIPVNPYDTTFEVLENPYDEIPVELLFESFNQ